MMCTARGFYVIQILISTCKYRQDRRRVIMEGQKVEVMSTTRVEKSNDLYKIVDSLNRTLKDQNLMFGLALDENDENTAVFTIYRT